MNPRTLSPIAPAAKSDLAARIRDMEQNIYAAEQDGNDCIDYGSLDRLYEEYADLPAAGNGGQS